MTIAFTDKLFDAHCVAHRLDSDLGDHIWRVLGLDIMSDVWPLDDHHYDHYDSSLELDGCVADFRLTPEQRTGFWELGFQRIWLNHVDGWETYYATTLDGESRKQKPVSP